MKKTLTAFAALSALALAGGAFALPAPARAAVEAPAAGAELAGSERSAALARASAALNRIVAAQGRFTQVAPNGATSAGQITIARPGKLRFEYDAPSPITIVSDGSTVAMQNRSLKEVTRFPLRATPLYYVLKDGVNLEKDAKITRVARVGDTLEVTAKDRTGRADGQITIVFAGANYDLAQWSIIDGQSQTTKISLSDVRPTGKISPRLFQLPASNALPPR